MPSVSHLMREYFDSATKSQPDQSTVRKLSEHFSIESLPVTPDKTEWRVVSDPERFIRRFEFDNRNRLKDFVSEVLSLEDILGHHGKLSINHDSVDIEVYTHTVDCITELDQEYATAVNKLYEDVLHYGYNNTI